MHIHVEYMAQLRDRAGCSQESLTLPADSRLGDLFTVIAARHGDSMQALLYDAQGNRSPTVLAFVASEQADADDVLTEGAVVTLMTPISGG